MRHKIDAELAAVADEFQSGGITWCRRDVRRLIKPYPARSEVDHILARLDDDYYHDDVHRLTDGDDDAAVAEGKQEEASDSRNETGDVDNEPADVDNEPVELDLAAGAAESAPGGESAKHEDSRKECAPLSASEAAKVHQVGHNCSARVTY